MNPIHRDAILMAGMIRRKLKFSQFQPINIFEVCLNLDIIVQFVDINMDGFYAKVDGIAKILISHKRPFPRRCYSTAHELGHHVFNHGLKIDVLFKEADADATKEPDEILVDAFAAAFLMPVGGIQAEFVKRRWAFDKASSLEYYIISSLFGVGYKTLILHCKHSNLITLEKATELQKHTPAKILKSLSDEITNAAHFKIIDDYCSLETVDMEVSNYVILPTRAAVENDYLQKITECEHGDMYLILKPGITTVQFFNVEKSIFLRIQKENYTGFAEYRYLEN